FQVPVKDANPVDAVEFLNRPSAIGMVTRLGGLVLFGLGLRFWSSRPAVRRKLEKLQSNASNQSALLGLGSWIPFVLLWLTAPVAIRFSKAPVGVIQQPPPWTLHHYSSAFLTPIAIACLTGFFAWSLKIGVLDPHIMLVRKVQQIAQRHIIAWMSVGFLMVTLVTRFVWWVGRVMWELAAGAINIAGYTDVFDPAVIYLVLVTVALVAMSGAALLGLRLLESMIRPINKSFFLRFSQSSWGWLALSVFGVLALRGIILHFEGWKLAPYMYRWGGPFSPALHQGVYWAVFWRTPLTLSVIAIVLALRSFPKRSPASTPATARRVEE
ncbi:MAG: hypothetical protein J0L84_11555, partial [Verrucomicrobia bacterium]|nr:hypothetical protein [Verrucomicrobiota bacterium]